MTADFDGYVPRLLCHTATDWIDGRLSSRKKHTRNPLPLFMTLGSVSTSSSLECDRLAVAFLILVFSGLHSLSPPLWIGNNIWTWFPESVPTNWLNNQPSDVYHPISSGTSLFLLSCSLCNLTILSESVCFCIVQGNHYFHVTRDFTFGSL